MKKKIAQVSEKCDEAYWYKRKIIGYIKVKEAVENEA